MKRKKNNNNKKEYLKCMKDEKYFIEKYVKIFNNNDEKCHFIRLSSVQKLFLKNLIFFNKI